jgi:hypothetical protein
MEFRSKLRLWAQRLRSRPLNFRDGSLFMNLTGLDFRASRICGWPFSCAGVAVSIVAVGFDLPARPR